jgi:hypothetical protein
VVIWRKHKLCAKISFGDRHLFVSLQAGRRVSVDGDCGRIEVIWIMAHEFHGLDIYMESACFGVMTANRMIFFRCSIWT